MTPLEHPQADSASRIMSDSWLTHNYQFRNRDRSNRPGRGQTEHNVLEGLPINQYREIEITVGPNAADNKPVDVNAWPELPMPRDSHMLPEHSQQLLRAARSGRTIKPPAPPEDDDNEMKEEEPETKEVSVGFTVKKYVKVARHNEAPEPEFLAKRRKGLPSQFVNGQVQAPLRETKVKKLDAEGNVAVYKVLAPEGQAVEGEVAATDAAIEVAPVIAAPGTVVEGVGVVNAEGVVVANDVLQQTPPRRRPPPPKKKKQRPFHRVGSGRGRKRVDFADGAEGQETPIPTAGGEIPAIRDLKAEEGDSVEASDRDTPMGEAGEDDESGEEGSEDDEQDQEDGTPATPSRAPAAANGGPVVEMTDAPETTVPAEPIVVTELSTTIPLENLQPASETEQPAETSTLEADAPVTVHGTSNTTDPVLSIGDHSEQTPIDQLPTSAATIEPDAAEPLVLGTGAVDPVASEPTATEPIAPESAALEPTASETTAEPIMEPVTEQATEPTTEPTITEPIAPQPAVSDTVASEPIASDPIPAPVPSTETESVPASVDIPAGEPTDASVSVPEPEPVKAPSPEQVSVPPSAGTPDLLGSLEAELDKKE